MSSKATSLLRRILVGTLNGVPIPDSLSLDSITYISELYFRIVEYLKHNPESDIVSAGHAVGFNTQSLLSDETCIPPKTYDASLKLVDEFNDEVERMKLKETLKSITHQIDQGINTANIKNELAGIFHLSNTRESIMLSSTVDSTVDKIIDAHHNNSPVGVPFGISSLVIDGIPVLAPKGKITTVGGAPKNGKSSVIQSSVVACCEAGLPSLLFSPEDQRGVIVQTLISRHTGIPLHHIVYNKLSNEEISIINNVRNIIKAMISLVRICDTPSLTPEKFLSISLADIYDRGTQAIYLDYVQIVRSANYRLDERQVINKVIDNGTYIAGKEDVSVILASQLKRPENDTPDRYFRPTVQQLKGSGNFGERTKGPVILVGYPYISCPDEFPPDELYLYIPFNSFGPPHPDKIIAKWNPRTKTIL